MLKSWSFEDAFSELLLEHKGFQPSFAGDKANSRLVRICKAVCETCRPIFRVEPTINQTTT